MRGLLQVGTISNSRMFEYDHIITNIVLLTSIFHNFLMDTNSKFDLQVVLSIAFFDVCWQSPKLRRLEFCVNYVRGLIKKVVP